jgi:hypothetical protein
MPERVLQIDFSFRNSKAVLSIILEYPRIASQKKVRFGTRLSLAYPQSFRFTVEIATCP